MTHAVQGVAAALLAASCAASTHVETPDPCLPGSPADEAVAIDWSWIAPGVLAVEARVRDAATVEVSGLRVVVFADRNGDERPQESEHLAHATAAVAVAGARLRPAPLRVPSADGAPLRAEVVIGTTTGELVRGWSLE